MQITSSFNVTWLSVVSDVKKVSAVASSRDAQDTSSQQQQQDDTVETIRQMYLSSGKFNFNVIHFLKTSYHIISQTFAMTFNQPELISDSHN